MNLTQFVGVYINELWEGLLADKKFFLIFRKLYSGAAQNQRRCSETINYLKLNQL